MDGACCVQSGENGYKGNSGLIFHKSTTLQKLGVVGAILIGFSLIFFHTDCTVSHKSIE